MHQTPPKFPVDPLTKPDPNTTDPDKTEKPDPNTTDPDRQGEGVNGGDEDEGRQELPNCMQEQGGSALGKNFLNRTAFEVREAHRGNVARALFYFAVRYDLHIDAAQEETLRLWHVEDTVDDAELKRNDAVEALQHNRNPFIDHPEFVEKIADF
jgi:endonuclease I